MGQFDLQDEKGSRDLLYSNVTIVNTELYTSKVIKFVNLMLDVFTI